VSGPVAAVATARLWPTMGLLERIPIFGFVQWAGVTSIDPQGRDTGTVRGVGRKCVRLEHAWGKAAAAGPDAWISGRDHSGCEYGTSRLRYEGISLTAG
jgi:hypothetical protein